MRYNNLMEANGNEPGDGQPGDQANGDLDEGLELNPEDVVEVIDIDEQPPNEGQRRTCDLVKCLVLKYFKKGKD